MSEKIILDACCGSKMMWFDRKHPAVLYADIREENMKMADEYQLVVSPDVVADFRQMPFADETFKLVVFDPPHVVNLSGKSIIGQKYGTLFPSWREDIKAGFDECMRVLQPHGVLIFKWNEVKIKLADVLSAIGAQPLFGHTSGKHGKTIWMTFMKFQNP